MWHYIRGPLLHVTVCELRQRSLPIAQIAALEPPWYFFAFKFRRIGGTDLSVGSNLILAKLLGLAEMSLFCGGSRLTYTLCLVSFQRHLHLTYLTNSYYATNPLVLTTHKLVYRIGHLFSIFGLAQDGQRHRRVRCPTSWAAGRRSRGKRDKREFGESQKNNVSEALTYFS